MRKNLYLLATFVIMASMVLTACAAQPAAPVVITQIVAGTPIVVTATPETAAPSAPVSFTSKDPTSFVNATIGDMVTMDPALAYDTASGEVIQNTYETLIFYKRNQAAEFVPQLATEVPTVENGGISADGKTVTFKIRTGVKFHNGDTMTASDVAYSLVRGLLQSGPDSPQWLMTEPFFGIGMQDISMVVQAVQEGADGSTPLTEDQIGKAQATTLTGDPTALQAVDAAVLKTTCDWTNKLVVADDAANTVTLHLNSAWGPLLPTLANTWGSVMDKKWVAENKGWDGTCETWQNFYGVTAENNPINAIENGTGPYKLSNWNQGQEIDLEAFDGYWRTEAAWEGGPTGVAALKNVAIKQVPEWGTRFSMLQAGDADTAYVPRANTSQIMPLVSSECDYDIATGDYKQCADTSTPDQPLRLDKGAPGLTQDTLMFNFKINTEGGNSYIGSGKLDGMGIPPEFFSDEHVRKAFEYCFNADTIISDAWVGEAVQSFTLALPGMPGNDAAAAHYSYNLDKCTEEFKASTLTSADGKSLWDTGFRFQLTYNTGNAPRLTTAQVISSAVAKVNKKFVVEILGVPWPTILNAYQHSRLPAFIIGWQEDIHDPHNWYQPFLVGTYGNNQNFPADLKAAFMAKVSAGVAEPDPAKRDVIYKELNQMIYDNATMMILPVPTGRHYEQMWVNGWFYNPLYGGQYYYTLSKK
jgi:peptide/nickel transport system substrate-binding protein